ncbi:AP-4 complex accessory subunit RUSC2-like isoform X2 [Brienomyrus brachyistius]|uniref:AP-4 complex accessory subunit RUSC2-like isoform X2 n=1 Tax=Brienomyrus brachyistius TaxID=42636 RepID=UPI0020B43AD7|nr:AP-4 complex accessory subunit RUSC2-like isoform X2 [Brienomyrus brachyistius]
MDSPPKLSGETLIVHHLPLVHCQVQGRQCCSPGGNTNPFGSPEHLGLTRTTSLPERDVLHREALVYSSLIQTSSSSSSSCAGGCGGGGKGSGGGGGGSVVSDSSSFTSNASEEFPRPRPHHRGKGNPLRHNPFLLDAEDEEDAEDDDGDDLSGYLEDCSFHLHNSSSDGLDNGMEPLPFRLHGPGYARAPLSAGTWPSDMGHLGPMKATSRLDSLNLFGLDCQRRHGSSGSTLSMDCGEQEWGEEEEEEDFVKRTVPPQRCCCCSGGGSVSALISENQPSYASDSSCNSSDGVLVSFSAMYNRMNNAVPAKPLNLNASAEHSCGSSTSEPSGAFYLDLHASPAEPQGSNPAPCGCPSPPPALDANCNSYHPPCEAPTSEACDLTSCLQSRARLVLATQNYYKLVTCDLSSQSSPSPAASSIASCSEDPGRASPAQPTEYYLFRQPAEDGQGVEEPQSQCEDDPDETKQPEEATIEGQVYVNVSPPLAGRVGRPRSRSYDQDLDLTRASGTSLASLERMLSCPVRLSEGALPTSPPVPPRVTSFAEIARSKRRSGAATSGSSPFLKSSTEASSTNSQSSQEFSPIPELPQLGKSRSLPPLPFSYCCSQTGHDTALQTRCQLSDVDWSSSEARATAEGGSSDVIRYSKDQRPTTLPIQPFTLQQQLGKPQVKPLRPLLGDYVSHVYGRRAPDAARPSPLGSHSPVRQQGAPSSGSCSTCSPSSPQRPPRSLSCPLSAGLLPLSRSSPGHIYSLHDTHGSAPPEPRVKVSLPSTPPPPPSDLSAATNHCLHLPSLPTLQSPALGSQAHPEPVHRCGSRDVSLANCAGPRLPNGQSMKHHYYGDFFPDYFSLTEKPPEEFCLSPDAASESISIDLLQKKGLVKAINTAVDLIVAHFGTSRDPGVKAKLGNSSVSPNVGHLILKYLCPAIRGILQDGLRAYVLDLIIGQRRNVPWSVVEASTQPGPSTRVLHNLFSKVSHYSELTNHSMRFNAFVFGLLNLRSLEFWFNHLYTHEDIVAAHYHPWGFLLLSQATCHPLFEELLLLLQPLSLLPFDLDLLFEPRLLRKGQEHQRNKKELCSTGQGLDGSMRSTFQLMRGLGLESKSEVLDTGLKERIGLWNKEAWSMMEGARSRKDGIVQRKEAVGLSQEGIEGNRIELEAKDRRRTEGEPKLAKRGADLWGDSREGAPWGALRATGVGREEVKREGETEREPQFIGGAKPRDRQAGWWYQLMQSSQVYIDNSTEGSKFVKWEKRKKPTGECQGARVVEDLGLRQQSQPPLREGVVEGAEAIQEKNAPKANGGPHSKAKGKPFWMGSPPESVLNELKKSEEKEPEGQRGVMGAEEEPPQGMRWSRLFGATVGPPKRTQNNTERHVARSQKNRLPSEWLSLDKSVLDFMAQTVGAGKKLHPPPPPQKQVAAASQQLETQASWQPPPRVMQSHHHHIAIDPGHLSFGRGNVLRVMACAQPDWEDHSPEDHTDAAPIAYASLSEKPSGTR